jgi:hypothetical protein
LLAKPNAVQEQVIIVPDSGPIFSEYGGAVDPSKISALGSGGRRSYWGGI